MRSITLPLPAIWRRAIGCPCKAAKATDPWEQEGSQAPLYYLITGGLTRWIDQSDFAAITVYNPQANIGSPFVPGNKNRMLYSALPLPLRGTNLALHIGRWVSVLLGAFTLWCTYRTAQLAFPAQQQLALAALLLHCADSTIWLYQCFLFQRPLNYGVEQRHGLLVGAYDKFVKSRGSNAVAAVGNLVGAGHTQQTARAGIDPVGGTADVGGRMEK